MYQNYVVEVKKDAQGNFEHNVFWLYDENQNKAQLKAEGKYHEILSAAAVSNMAEHSAILFTSQGFPIEHKCYIHETLAQG